MNGTRHSAEYVDDETRAHQERTASIRFKQSIIQGIGSPMVFGLVFAACGALFHLAFGAQIASLVGGAAGAVPGAGVTTAAVSLTWPLVAIGVMFAVGVGCIYFGSRLNSELSRIEQNYGAKQIAKGINGKSLEIEQKPIPFPTQDKPVAALDVAEGMNTAQPTVNAVQLQERVVPIDVLTKAKA